MSTEPEIGTNIGPTNKNMNCDAWGTYESPNSSPTAVLCNGGMLDGRLWAPCPSREDCRRARNERVLSQARNPGPRLPMAQSTVRVVGSQSQSAYGGYSSPAPTSIPQRPIGAPAQVHRAESGNPYIDTPRVLTPSRPGMHSPTFMPEKEEHWASRLFRNMVQGVFNSMGWHVHDYTQHVDIFPYGGKKNPPPDGNSNK
jgi:hypothetical protein